MKESIRKASILLLVCWLTFLTSFLACVFGIHEMNARVHDQALKEGMLVDTIYDFSPRLVLVHSCFGAAIPTVLAGLATLIILIILHRRSARRTHEAHEVSDDDRTRPNDGIDPDVG